MDLILISLISFIFIAIIGFAMYVYFGSQMYRIRSIEKSYKRKKLEKISEIEQKIFEYENFSKDDQKILELILKIKQGKEVEIPIVAFDYIYRNINSLVQVKDGKFVITSSEKFEEFKEKSSQILKEKVIEKYEENDSNLEEGSLELIDVQEHSDGTIVYKDFDTGDIEIIKPDGTVYIQDNIHKTLTIRKPIEKEDNNNKNNNKNPKTLSNDETKKIKKMEMRINELQNIINNPKKDSQIEINNPKKDSQIEINNPKKDSQIEINNLDEIDKVFEELLIDKSEIDEQKNIKKDNQNSFLNLIKTKNIENKNIENKNIENKNIENKNIENKNIENKNEKGIDLLNKFLQVEAKKTSFEKEFDRSKMQSLCYINPEQIVNDICNDSIHNFFKFLLLINNPIYGCYYIYKEDERKIFLNVNLLLYKLYCLLSDTDKKIYLDEVIGGVSSKIFNSEFVENFINILNNKIAIKEGFKPFYYNSNSNNFLVKKYLEFTSGDKTIRKFEGAFLILNIKNKIFDSYLSEDFFEVGIKSLEVKELEKEVEQKYFNLTFKYLYDLK